MCFLPLKSSHYPSWYPNFLASTRPDPSRPEVKNPYPSDPGLATSLTGDQSDGQLVGKFVRRAMMENRFISKLKKDRKQGMAIKRRKKTASIPHQTALMMSGGEL